MALNILIELFASLIGCWTFKLSANTLSVSNW